MGKPATNARGKAIEHERKTGQIANMQQLGWVARRRSKVDGKCLEFTKGERFKGGEWWRLSRSAEGNWYAARNSMTTTRYPIVKKVRSPSFDGPVTLAVWLSMEIANDTVRFD